MSVEEKRTLIQSFDIGEHRASRNAEVELQRFSLSDIRSVLNCLSPLKPTAGSNNPCGPVFNRHRDFPLWARILIWSFLSLGSVSLFPLQVAATSILLFRGKLGAIWKEIPRPTQEMMAFFLNMSSCVKAPLELVKESVKRKAALCVNRNGYFSTRDRDYTVMSHVWGETMGWQTPDGWGPVDLSLRRKGISRAHFLRFFDQCGAEWLWVDAIAMPEVLEDMTPAQKEEIEDLRVGVINSLYNIYTKADKVVVLDTLLLRLSTRSLIDVAVVLCLGFWMNRLWTFTEAKLARKVILKTKDSSFDLDQVIAFFGRYTLNDQDRYYELLRRLWPLRDPSLSGFPQLSPMETAYYANWNRWTSVEVDAARALFPFFQLEWENGWTLQQGMAKIVEALPGETEILRRYCEYRRIHIDPVVSVEL